MSEQHLVILLPSTNHALRGEKLLKRAGLEVKVVPVPRHLSSDCGISLRILAAQEEQVRQAMAAGGLEYEGIHPV